MTLTAGSKLDSHGAKERGGGESVVSDIEFDFL